MNYNIFGDIAGNFLTLQALIKKMPEATPISLGDMVDRGPRGKEVLEFFMKHGKAVLGNHEHMMIDLWKQETDPNYKPYYSPHIWLGNGGYTTMQSFDKDSILIENNSFSQLKKVSDIVDEKYIKWLQSLPLFIEFEKIFLSHAPKPKHRTVNDATNLGAGFASFYGDAKSETSLIWNRADPAPLEDKLQLFGHNAYEEVRYYSNQYKNGTRIDLLNDAETKDTVFAMGIDTSKAKVLTGIHYPSMKIYQQEYID